MRDGRRQLVVIGAGFAGLACARAAAQRGVETTVLEAQPEPGHRVRTTGVLVKEAADAWDVPRSLTRKIHGVRLYSPSLDWVDLERPGYYFLATETGALLAWWAREAARHGVEVCWDVPFSGSQDVSDGTVWLLGQGFGCEYLVGADGARSTVARDRGLDANQELLSGFELECVGLGGVAEDRLHVFLDSELAPGYIAWIVPGTSCYQVGLACRHPHRPDPEALIASLSRRFDTRHLTVLGHRCGWIPVGGPLRRIGDRAQPAGRRRRRLGVAADRRRHPHLDRVGPPRRHRRRRPPARRRAAPPPGAAALDSLLPLQALAAPAG